MAQQDTTMPSDENQREDIKRVILQYVQYWHWFVLGIAIALVVAFIYIRYSTSIYHTQSEMKIEQAKNFLDLSGLNGARGSSSLFGQSTVNLEDETEILKSRRLLDSVVEELKLNTRYYGVGSIKSEELWKDQVPFEVNWIKIDSTPTQGQPSFTLNFKTPTQFTIGIKDENISKTGSLDTPISLKGYRISILPNPDFNKKAPGDITDTDYLFRYNSKTSAINRLKGKLKVEQVGKYSDVLKVSIQGPNRQKNEVILNTLMAQFNMDGIRDRQIVSKRAGEFIDKRLKSLVKELDTIETHLVNFKQKNNLTTIQASTMQLYGVETGAEQKHFNTEVRKQLTKNFQDHLLHGKEYTLLPANLGIESSNINSLTAAYNQIVLERNQALNTATLKNPNIVKFNKKLDDIRKNILTSIDAYIANLNLALQNYKSRQNASNKQLYSMPGKAKEVRSIMRMQEIKEQLYLFLLQKREEAALRYATTSPTVKIVDYAYTSPMPVAPKSKLIYLAALIFGFLVPFGILYLKFLFDTKVYNRETIERRIGVKVLGEIPNIKASQKLVVKNDRSVLAEAFRILRTNLNFFKSNASEGEAGVVFVTSTVKGEGKTFVAINLANTFASMGKKTLMLGADLRNPQTHRYYGIDKSQVGISTFVTDPSVTIDDIINRNTANFDELDFIMSGQIPPNPVEILLSERFKEIMAYAKANYDYVIVDTAPTMMVTDTLLISHFADVTLYLSRAGFTDFRLLEHIKEVQKTKKLTNIGIVLNDVSEKSGYGYGYSYNYGYGYGYSADTPPAWWKFWKKR